VFRSASAASRISRSPGRKTSTSPGPIAVQLVAGIDDGIVEVALVLALCLLGLDRAVAHFDRIQAARNLDHRRIVEVLEKRSASIVAEVMITFRSGRFGSSVLEVAEQEIDVQAALVRLVDDQRVVLAEQRVALRLGEQDAVGHQLDVGAGDVRSVKRIL
jgi:hypothetical protein